MTKKIKKKERNYSITISLLVFIVIVSMTFGYARFSKLVNVSGTLVVQGNGAIFISNVTKGTHNHATSNPVISQDRKNIDFNLEFTTVNQNNATYSAAFNITIANESVYDFLFANMDYQPTINRKSNGQVIDPSFVSYAITGIKAGDKIAAHTTKTFTVTVTFNSPTASYTDTFVIDGDMLPEVTEDTSAHILAAVNDNVLTGDLRGSNYKAPFSVNVLSTYGFDTNFTISLSSDLYSVVNASDNPLGTQVIHANDQDDYTFYIMEVNNTHYVTEDRVTVYVTPEGLPKINAGIVSLLVDKNAEYDDVTAPYIWNVQATVQDTNGEVYLEWEAEDDIRISYFNITVFDTNNQQVGSVRRTSDDTPHTTITGLPAGDYTFVVSGVDAKPNTATSSEITGATTSRGHACRSAEMDCRWSFTVKFKCSNNLTCPSDSTVSRNATFNANNSVNMTASGNYNAPGSLTSITSDGTDLSTTYYTYTRNSNNQKQATLQIRNIVGNIEVEAEGVYSYECLIEGTKVLLANGTYKKVEDLEYHDLMLVVDHITGKFSYAYPVWIEEGIDNDRYIKITFDDGTVLNTAISGHSVFDVDENKYRNVQDDSFKEGSRVYKLDTEARKLKIITVVKKEIIHKHVKYHNVITVGFYNFFAEDILGQETFANATNVYGFGNNLKYSYGYKLVRLLPKLPYEYFVNTVPHHIFIGAKLENAYTMVGSEFDEEFLRTYAFEKIREPYKINGNNAWMMTTSLDDLSDYTKHLYEEGTYYTLPKAKGVKCFINTFDDVCYKPGSKIKVETSFHFMAKY